MLKIIYGEIPEAIYNTSLYFNNTYLDHEYFDKLMEEYGINAAVHA